MPEFYGVPRESTRETPTMLRVIRICRKCGARIFADAPEGLCPRCVLKTALAMPPELVAGGGSSAVAAYSAEAAAKAGSAKADDSGNKDELSGHNAKPTSGVKGAVRAAT